MADLATSVSLVDVAKRGVQRVRKGFRRPDDDWAPVLLVRTDAGRMFSALMVMGEDKDAVAAGLRQMLSACGAVEAALVTSSWMVTASDDVELDEHVRACEHPARRECVVISYVDKARVGLEIADIHRSAVRPPTLGAFSGVEGIGVRGSFIDAMRQGISTVKAATG
jgi:hypothetical protein